MTQQTKPKLLCELIEDCVNALADLYSLAEHDPESRMMLRRIVLGWVTGRDHDELTQDFAELHDRLVRGKEKT